MPELNPPDLQVFSGKTEEWKGYQDSLFDIFKNTIVRGGLTFQGLEVKTRYVPSTENKHFTFWHLITEGKIEEERTPDPRRCERIEWISWIIINHNHPSISFWESPRGRSKEFVIWCEEHDFAVVLSKRSNYYLLKTAYSGFSKHKIKTWKKERTNYIKSLKS